MLIFSNSVSNCTFKGAWWTWCNHYSTIWVSKSENGYNLQILLMVVLMQDRSDNLPPAQTWITWFHLGIGCQRRLKSWALQRSGFLTFFPFPSVILRGSLISGGFCHTINSEYLFLTYAREIAIEILVGTSEK